MLQFNHGLIGLAYACAWPAIERSESLTSRRPQRYFSSQISKIHESNSIKALSTCVNQISKDTLLVLNFNLKILIIAIDWT